MRYIPVTKPFFFCADVSHDDDYEDKEYVSDKNNDDNGDDEQEPTDGPRRTPPQEPLLALAERNV